MGAGSAIADPALITFSLDQPPPAVNVVVLELLVEFELVWLTLTVLEFDAEASPVETLLPPPVLFDDVDVFPARALPPLPPVAVAVPDPYTPAPAAPPPAPLALALADWLVLLPWLVATAWVLPPEFADAPWFTLTDAPAVWLTPELAPDLAP
jgi:hypothetical protein